MITEHCTCEGWNGFCDVKSKVNPRSSHLPNSLLEERRSEKVMVALITSSYGKTILYLPCTQHHPPFCIISRVFGLLLGPSGLCVGSHVGLVPVQRPHGSLHVCFFFPSLPPSLLSFLFLSFSFLYFWDKTLWFLPWFCFSLFLFLPSFLLP